MSWHSTCSAPARGRTFTARLARRSPSSLPARAGGARERDRRVRRPPALRARSGSTTGRLVPFDVGPNGQLTERTDQAITVAGSTTGLLVDRRARSVFVSSRDVYCRGLSSTPGMIAVYRIAADGSLSLAQTLTSSRFAMALAPDGSRLYAQKLNGELDSYAVLADGTLGAETAPFPFTQPANMLAAVARWAHALHGRAERALVPVVDRAGLRALVPLARRVRHVLLAVHRLRPGSSSVDFQCFNGTRLHLHRRVWTAP